MLFPQLEALKLLQSQESEDPWSIWSQPTIGQVDPNAIPDAPHLKAAKVGQRLRGVNRVAGAANEAAKPKQPYWSLKGDPTHVADDLLYRARKLGVQAGDLAYNLVDDPNVQEAMVHRWTGGKAGAGPSDSNTRVASQWRAGQGSLPVPQTPTKAGTEVAAPSDVVGGNPNQAPPRDTGETSGGSTRPGKSASQNPFQYQLNTNTAQGLFTPEQMAEIQKALFSSFMAGGKERDPRREMLMSLPLAYFAGAATTGNPAMQQTLQNLTGAYGVMQRNAERPEQDRRARIAEALGLTQADQRTQDLNDRISSRQHSVLNPETGKMESLPSGVAEPIIGSQIAQRYETPEQKAMREAELAKTRAVTQELIARTQATQLRLKRQAALGGVSPEAHEEALSHARRMAADYAEAVSKLGEGLGDDTQLRQLYGLRPGAPWPSVEQYMEQVYNDALRKLQGQQYYGDI